LESEGTLRKSKGFDGSKDRSFIDGTEGRCRKKHVDCKIIIGCVGKYLPGGTENKKLAKSTGPQAEAGQGHREIIVRGSRVRTNRGWW